MQRVVSLVPSLSESVAETGRLVGVTDYCTHPVGLVATRIGGTKNPSIEAILALEPDLVLANEEENREADLAALGAAGVAVRVTRIRSLAEAFSELGTLFTDALELPEPDWLPAARSAWAGVMPGEARTAVIPIWRRPWMVVGSDTFAGDVLARLGVHNAYAADPDRYPRVALTDLQAAELVVLPDEPYAFSATDGPECFPDQSVALVSGRHLTWYGPSLVEAPAVLATQLR